LETPIFGFVLAATVTLGLTSSPAHAMEGTQWGDGGGLTLVFAPVVAAGAVAAGADVYFTVNDIAQTWFGLRSSKEEGRHELYWTAWQSGLLVPIATGLLLGSNGGENQTPAVFFAATVWPLCLTAHGLWYAAPSARWAPISMVAAADGMLLGYDIQRRVTNQPFNPKYAELEIALGSGQLLYGLGNAVRGHATERWLNLSLTSVPLTLIAHGVYTVLEFDFPRKRATSRLPKVAAQPIPGGMMLTWGDRW